MCGIVGVIGEEGVPELAVLNEALDLLSHRGPDARGTLEAEGVWFGHRRLSIIDLSAAADQPFIDEQSGCAIIFNGEIYNYLELRLELQQLGHVFRTVSDTEVLLRAYLVWGVGCLNRLNGMWAFAVWDPRSKKVFLARDRFGVKPLYFTTIGRQVSFASEPKSLLHLYPRLRKVNLRSLYRFMAHSDLYGDNESFYVGIDLLPPGCYAFVDPKNPAVRPMRFWSLAVQQKVPSDGGSALEEFSSLFESAVSLRLRSDVPLGLSLSGGIDSSCILGATRSLIHERPTCLTAVYGLHGEGEMGWATIAAALAGASLLPIAAKMDDWEDTMPKISWHMDAPGYSPAVFPMWKMMERARELHIPVMLEGQGADEAFGGYPHYVALLLASLLREGKFKSFARSYTQLAGTFPRKLLVSWLLRESFPAVFGLYRKVFGGQSLLRKDVFGKRGFEPSHDNSYDPTSTESVVTQRLRSDFTKGILPGLLHYGDAISMAHSTETRLPFMDYRIAQWIFSSADNLKIADGNTKVILRDYLRHLGMSEIADRRDKRGFPTPIREWLVQNDYKAAQHILLAPNSRILDYCERRAIDALIQRGRRNPLLVGDNLYKLVSTEYWLRACIT